MTGNLFPARLRSSHQEKRQNHHYRRNGKLQACEPCRKGKLRCDHMMPSCGRCSRLNKVDKCVYHPAPMTKAGSAPTSTSPASGRSSPSTNSFATIYAARSGQEHQDHQSAHHKVPSQTSIDPPSYNSKEARTTDQTTFQLSIPRPPRADSAVAQNAYLTSQPFDEIERPLPDQRLRADALAFDRKSGLTSNSALLCENEYDLGISECPSELDILSQISPWQIDRGAAVLSQLKDLPAIQRYIDKLFSFAGGIVVIEPMVKIYMEGLRSSWHRFLEEQGPGDLRVMSEKLWQNTMKPVSGLLDRDTTPREFCSSITGEELRWETVGIIVSLVSLMAQSLGDGDPIFCSPEEAPRDRAKLALRMYNASEMCVGFCDEVGALNDPYLWLLYENSITYCSMRNKGSYENAKKTSRLATALLSCNLHQKIEVDDNTPFFIAELRKRLFVCAYENDKYAAAFAGRPPKLTRQYSRLQIPLDLTDAQTMSSNLSTDIAGTILDKDGWNEHGMVQGCTFARLSAANALILEETLEISLGNLSDDAIVRRARDIQAKVDKHWSNLPSFLRLDLDDPWNGKRSPYETLILFFIRLNHLDHHFLLRRTLNKVTEHSATDTRTSLLSICSEIFQVVMLMVTNSQFFRDFQIDFVQIMVKYGIPAAAVLAMELLHQERTLATTAAEFPLHRSDTIQNLSVFVSCLGTAKPESNGYQGCQRGRRFFKTILDTILGAGTAVPKSSSASWDTSDPTLGSSLFEPGNDADFAQWLDTMTWDAENWIHFS